MRRLDAISILTLVLSAGTLVITAVGTGNMKSGGDMPPPSTPIVVDAEGREAGALCDLIDEGVVGVIVIEADSI